MNRQIVAPLVIVALALVGACGQGEKPAAPAAGAPAAAPSGPVQPCPTCKIIEIQMITTDAGNYFEPKEIEAHEGDVLRFKLMIGVHNVNFLADSNPGIANLPAVSEMLQLPGQTHDVAMNFGTGRFFFQCDPHAALGMVGHVKVEKKDS